jgi:hypothetical protein
MRDSLNAIQPILGKQTRGQQKQPTMTARIFGNTEASEMRLEPQAGQKWISTVPPDFPVREKNLTLPRDNLHFVL